MTDETLQQENDRLREALKRERDEVDELSRRLGILRDRPSELEQARAMDAMHLAQSEARGNALLAVETEFRDALRAAKLEFDALTRDRDQWKGRAEQARTERDDARLYIERLTRELEALRGGPMVR